MFFKKGTILYHFHRIHKCKSLKSYVGSLVTPNTQIILRSKVIGSWGSIILFSIISYTFDVIKQNKLTFIAESLFKRKSFLGHFQQKKKKEGWSWSTESNPPSAWLGGIDVFIVPEFHKCFYTSGRGGRKKT